jgi:hypothetical protein
MLTDEELTTRLSTAFHESVPELTYAGPVPQVRRRGTGLATTSVMAATAALVLTPAALQRGGERSPESVPSLGTHHDHQGRTVTRTLELGGIRLLFASVDGDLGPLYLVLGDNLAVPPDAQKVDLGVPFDVWFVDHPASGEPQVYVGHRTCPDTIDGCAGSPPPLEVYGILAPGWTHEQLVDLLEHPVDVQRDLN